MAMYFECKLRYEKMQENGVVKKVTESYIVDSMSFTEAEERITREMLPYISGDFSVVAIKRTKIAEIFHDEEADKWWLVKVNFITLNEKTGKEKKTTSLILVQANDSDSAQKNFIEGMKGTVADFEIAGINETAYIEVFLHQ